jgi:hypothetical protein
MEKDIVPTKIVTKVPETPFEPPTVQLTLYWNKVKIQQELEKLLIRVKFFFSTIHFLTS